MNIIEVLNAVTALVNANYKGVEIAGILRNVANEIDPKGTANEEYNSSSFPTNLIQWEIFIRDWRACFRREYPDRTIFDNTQKIAAIKCVREMTRAGLKDSKDFVEANWDKFTLR